MQKNSIKYIIDCLLFVSICSISFIGFLLGFVIPKGKEAVSSEKFFLGIHRHDWGDIHLYLSIFMLLLLIIHVWMNWTWIIQSSKRYFKDQWETVLWSLCGAWIIVVFIGWIIVKF